jgi:tetratricopeptide (TPR) repeat protein
MGRDEEAEKSFREALKRNPRSDGAYLGLAKLYQKQQKLELALKMVDASLRLSPDIHGGHFLKGRILTELGRKKEASEEFAAAKKEMNTRLGKERESLGEENTPNPELMKEP